ncbi:Piso0_000164 [Millerozyma farinosa CBS 7064]|uniref:Piso0_000164 protein n=1 Tax=Pichia sorbitophila (strain ATCC MYA-4447 / BCRC 22081 / CBS 7064 / NBRC 10061 / NRRL Y-12695) TaxID=559304 RepID=G8YT92_PICSO|nr:Piso0_000164 [Millerozyma farinosa CBS 7064]
MRNSRHGPKHGTLAHSASSTPYFNPREPFYESFIYQLVYPFPENRFARKSLFRTQIYEVRSWASFYSQLVHPCHVKQHISHSGALATTFTCHFPAITHNQLTVLC